MIYYNLINLENTHMLYTILISAIVAFTVSLIFHYFTITQLNKYFDRFFADEFERLKKLINIKR